MYYSSSLVIAMAYFPHPHWREVEILLADGRTFGFDMRRTPAQKAQWLRRLWASLNPNHRRVTDNSTEFFDAIKATQTWQCLAS